MVQPFCLSEKMLLCIRLFNADIGRTPGSGVLPAQLPPARVYTQAPQPVTPGVTHESLSPRCLNLGCGAWWGEGGTPGDSHALHLVSARAGISDLMGRARLEEGSMKSSSSPSPVWVP